MAKYIGGRWVTDAELYPEQFMELPEDAEPKVRNHAVKLGDIPSEGRGERGKSRENTLGSSEKMNNTAKEKNKALSSILGATVPSWKNTKASNNAVNREKMASEVDDGAETFSEIYGKKRRETARAYAMKIVAMGAVSERKLRDKLALKEYTESETDDALEYVKSFGYVNDARVAQDMLEKLAARRWGRFKICHYLKGKGISSEVIEDLDFSEIDFPYYCAELMKKYGPERRDAMLRAVKNAGYTSDDIRAARRLMADE